MLEFPAYLARILNQFLENKYIHILLSQAAARKLGAIEKEL